MVPWFKALHPIWQALLATTFTWLATAVGAAVVFFFKSINRRLLDGMLGFAAGVMIAASYWSLLVLAITLHNIPEGLAVGVAFGALKYGLSSASLAGALALGTGIQNLPEGTAVSVPLRREGPSRLKSSWYGQLSAMMEPAAGVLGAGLVILLKPILPFALAELGDKTQISTFALASNSRSMLSVFLGASGALVLTLVEAFRG